MRRVTCGSPHTVLGPDKRGEAPPGFSSSFFFFCYRPIMSHETSPPWRTTVQKISPRSGRQHKAWSGAKRNPRNRWRKKEEPAKRGDRFYVNQYQTYRSSYSIPLFFKN